MKGILIYADTIDAVRELKTAAAALDSAAPVKAFAASDSLAEEAAGYVESYSAGDLPVQDAHAVAVAVSQAAEKTDCDVILLPADRVGKDLAGHLAQIMGVDALTGVFAFGENGLASRGALGGSLIEDSRIGGDAQIYAIAPKSFAQAEPAAASASKLDIDVPAPAVTVKSVAPKEGGRADVAAADVIVAVGCGFEEQSDMEAVEELAAKLNGAVGCTKPIATDRKWFPEDCIIGISGKTCHPSLVISIGISGQCQYWAGVRDAGTAVSINTDKNADIVGLSDASVIMDGPAAVAELIAKIG